ncbi:MAG: hypothetical protein B7C55_04760, partial [Actinomycetales bacterium mxb001]
MRGSAIAVAVGIPLALAAAAGFLAGMSSDGVAPEPAAASASSAPTAPSTAAASPEPSAASPSPSPSNIDPYVEAMSGGSETLEDGQSGRSDTNIADSDLEVLNWVETDDPVFFITIDDGLVRSPEALALIQEQQIPVTAFLTEYAVREHTDYFNEVTAYGGSVQNHTMVHGALNDPKTDVEWEICETQDRFEGQFGYRPWMLRPPYGAGPDDPDVLKYAQQCGINRIVLWNVVVSNDNKVEYWEPPIRSGDIVLLHWEDNLAEGLQTILELGRQQGLTPA